MSDGAFKELVQKVKEQSEPFVTAAMINGAIRASHGLIDTVTNENLSPRTFFRQIPIILGNSVQSAGRELLSTGLASIRNKRASSSKAAE